MEKIKKEAETMKNGKLYQSPEMEVRLLTECDVLSASGPISGTSGFLAGDYDLGGTWW